MSRPQDTATRTYVYRGQVHRHTRAFAKLQERRITAGVIHDAALAELQAHHQGPTLTGNPGTAARYQNQPAAGFAAQRAPQPLPYRHRRQRRHRPEPSRQPRAQRRRPRHLLRQARRQHPGRSQAAATRIVPYLTDAGVKPGGYWVRFRFANAPHGLIRPGTPSQSPNRTAIYAIPVE